MNHPFDDSSVCLGRTGLGSSAIATDDNNSYYHFDVNSQQDAYGTELTVWDYSGQDASVALTKDLGILAYAEELGHGELEGAKSER